MVEFGKLWSEIIHCFHDHSQVSQQIILVQTILYKVIRLKLARICAKYFKIAIYTRGFICTFAKCINLTEKGLVDFQSIRANWNKQFSVIATEKPSLPLNRVFSGPTFYLGDQPISATWKEILAVFWKMSLYC